MHTESGHSELEEVLSRYRTLLDECKSLHVRRKEKVQFVIIYNGDILVASRDNEETDRGGDGFNSKLALEDLKTLVLDCMYYARWEFNLNEDIGEKQFSIHLHDS